MLQVLENRNRCVISVRFLTLFAAPSYEEIGILIGICESKADGDCIHGVVPPKEGGLLYAQNSHWRGGPKR